MSFDTASDRTVEVRIGISWVSVENARENLEAELNGKSFHDVRAQTRAAWNDMLGRIEVEGGSAIHRTMFYTAVYRTVIHPSLFSDVDGSYREMDFEVHTSNRPRYTNISGWDVWRTEIPFLSIIAPEVMSDVIASMLANQEEGGWFPKFLVANVYRPAPHDPAQMITGSAYALGPRDLISTKRSTRWCSPRHTTGSHRTVPTPNETPSTPTWRSGTCPRTGRACGPSETRRGHRRPRWSTPPGTS